jgi:hypothetical protein
MRWRDSRPRLLAVIATLAAVFVTGSYDNRFVEASLESAK